MPAWDVDEGGLAMRIDGRSVVCHGHVVAAGLDRPVHAVTAALVFDDVGSAGHGDERHPQEVWVVGGDAERERPGLLEAVGDAMLHRDAAGGAEVEDHDLVGGGPQGAIVPELLLVDPRACGRVRGVTRTGIRRAGEAQSGAETHDVHQTQYGRRNFQDDCQPPRGSGALSGPENALHDAKRRDSTRNGWGPTRTQYLIPSRWSPRAYEKDARH